MVNGIDRGADFFYAPFHGLQTGDQVRSLDDASAGTDAQSKGLGPKECKT